MSTEVNQQSHGPGHDALHEHFGLSYASYLVIPRSFLQSMPDEWQGRMATLLREADKMADEKGCKWPASEDVSIEVRLKDRETKRFVRDDFAGYQRGSRRLW